MDSGHTCKILNYKASKKIQEEKLCDLWSDKVPIRKQKKHNP